MTEKNEIDRWRRSLEEAEVELEAKNRQLEDLRSFFCENLNRLVEAQDHEHEHRLSDELKNLELSFQNKDDIAGLKSSVVNLVDKASKIKRLPLSDDQSEEKTNAEKHGAELLVLIEALEGATSETQTRGLLEIKKEVSNIGSAGDLSRVIEQVVTLWTETTQATQATQSTHTPETKDPSQFCALLISEILYQLLEKISLPKDLSDRLGALKKQLQQGVTMNKWAGMLTEVSDMASYVQLKINHERIDIEVFLKQVTGRLKELDEYIQGSQNHFERTHMNSQALGDAVKQEMQNLFSSANKEVDINALKQQIQSGLAAIEKHIDGYKKSEVDHHAHADEDVRKLLGRLSELEQESKRLKARVQKERMQAQIDTLTGIANRLGYDQHLAQEYARWKRFDNPLSLVVWDIDHFKRINDDYGHAAGDKALKTIATLLASKVRETDYLARYGGEEFVLIMPGAAGDAAKIVADKLRETVERSGFHFKGAPVTITISAGVAEFNGDDIPVSVFERADKALYEAKQNGRNQVVIAPVKKE
ncbi:MAG: GGDEF domain-containing protein [Gammaproteobacteria bacterium]|nr:GGDEF domain-containing protein [Gammaproteobacteria bacterium]